MAEGAGQIRACEARAAGPTVGVVDERELVQRLAFKEGRVETMRALMGAVTATELRRSTTSPATFDALVEGLGDPHPQVRWGSLALLDHVPDRDTNGVVAPLLDDPVPRIRRLAAHALGCDGCKPDLCLEVPEPVVERLEVMAAEDPNGKVRMEARLTLANLRARRC
jgi:HEAT repeat protein